MAYDYVPVCLGQVNPLTFGDCLPAGIRLHAEFFRGGWSPGYPYMDEYTFRDLFNSFNPGHTEKEFQAYFANWGYFRWYDSEENIWWVGNNYLWVSALSPLNPCHAVWKTPPECPQRVNVPGYYPGT